MALERSPLEMSADKSSENRGRLRSKAEREVSFPIGIALLNEKPPKEIKKIVHRVPNRSGPGVWWFPDEWKRKVKNEKFPIWLRLVIIAGLSLLSWGAVILALSVF